MDEIISTGTTGVLSPSQINDLIKGVPYKTVPMGVRSRVGDKQRNQQIWERLLLELPYNEARRVMGNVLDTDMILQNQIMLTQKQQTRLYNLAIIDCESDLPAAQAKMQNFLSVFKTYARQQEAAIRGNIDYTDDAAPGTIFQLYEEIQDAVDNAVDTYEKGGPSAPLTSITDQLSQS